MKMLLVVLLFVLASSHCHGAVNTSLLWSGSEKGQGCSPPSFQQCVSCSEDSKEVTLHVLNVLKDPHLDQSICLKCTSQKYLLGMMEEAADKNSSFRFSGTYFNFALGWYIEAYNGVYANYSEDKSYWEILDGDLKPTPLGVSHYQPTNGETVTFNLTIDDSGGVNDLTRITDHWLDGTRTGRSIFLRTTIRCTGVYAVSTIPPPTSIRKLLLLLYWCFFYFFLSFSCAE